MSPFDYVQTIMETKKNLIVDAATEKDYSPFLTNRALSYYPDTILYAQEMNFHSSLDKKLQYDYLINTVRSMKRYKSKWAKKKDNSDIDAVQEFFGYSYQKAKIALSVLSKDQVKQIKIRIDKGGKNE